MLGVPPPGVEAPITQNQQMPSFRNPMVQGIDPHFNGISNSQYQNHFQGPGGGFNPLGEGSGGMPPGGGMGMPPGMSPPQMPPPGMPNFGADQQGSMGGNPQNQQMAQLLQHGGGMGGIGGIAGAI